MMVRAALVYPHHPWTSAESPRRPVCCGEPWNISGDVSGKATETQGKSDGGGLAGRGIFRPSLRPAFQFPPRHRLDDGDAVLAVIEARHRGEALVSARVLEVAGVLDADLFERFEAVGGEAGRLRRRV